MSTFEVRKSPLLCAEELWQLYDAVESRLTAPVSERMLDLVKLGPQMRVLDLATGRGEPALRAAKRVGNTGQVLAVEIEEKLLQMARQKALAAGLCNISWRTESAESQSDLPAEYFHAATARWGLMYMANPLAALKNVRRALLPGGALVAAFWAEPERVPYFTLPRRCLQRYRQVPAIDFKVPGTFRYAHLADIEKDFSAAGLTIDHVEEMEIPVFAAEKNAEVVKWAKDFGISRLLNDLPEDVEPAWEKDFICELEQIRTNGLIELGGVTRIVRAHATSPFPGGKSYKDE